MTYNTLLVLLFTVACIAQPDVPNHFSGPVTISTSSSKQEGYLYFDFTYQAYRFDADDNTSSVVTLFNVEQPARYQKVNGQCSVTLLPPNSQIFSMKIPSYATFGGYVTVNKEQCQAWSYDFLGSTHKFYVYNSTDIVDGKVSWRHAMASVVTPYLPQGLVVDVYEQEASPPDSKVFDISSWGCNPPPQSRSVFTFGGFARDSRSNKVLSNTKVTLTGPKNYTVTTNEQGFYLLSDVPSGDFTITATYQNYFDFNGFITIARNVLPGGVGDVSLVPKIGVGQWRATLTWDNEPRDLDFHVRSPNPACELSYNRRYCTSGQSTLELDLDTTEGYGPETVTWTGGSGKHVVYAYMFEGSTSFVTSNARFRLYNSDGLVTDVAVLTEFYDPKNRFWHILNFDPSGSPDDIQVINEVLPGMPSAN